MKKLLSLFIILALFINGFSQEAKTPLGTKTGAVQVLGSLYIDSILYVPVAPIAKQPLRLGALQFWSNATTGDTSLCFWMNNKWNMLGYVKDGYANINNKFYTKTQVDSIITSNSPRFQNNMTINLGGAAGYIGQFKDGDYLNVAGKTLDEFLAYIGTKAVHPTYVAPTASVGLSPSAGNYEYGYNFGTITASSGFSQNDGGSLISTTYYKDGSALGGSTFSITSLTTTVDVYVNKAYNQGPIKNDNLGNPDATGRIAAGSVNSGHVYLIPNFSYYIGTSATSTPTDAEIRAAVIGFGSSKAKNNINISVSGTKYVFYAYPSSQGTLTRIYNSLGDFTLDSSGWLLSTRSSFSNAQGATVGLNVYVLQSAQTGDVNGVYFQ